VRRHPGLSQEATRIAIPIMTTPVWCALGSFSALTPATDRWAAGDTDWDDGRARGEVTVDGAETSWPRWLAATGYLFRIEPAATHTSGRAAHITGRRPTAGGAA
jgi:hypothetical protein